MSSVLPPRRPIVLKASRDTVVLLAAVGAMTLALAYSVHNRPAPAPPAQTTAGEWAGQLAELPSPQAAAPAPAEPLSSDALTVPKAAMALPVPPRTPAAVVAAKPRACDGAPCPALPAAKTAAALPAAPSRRPAAPPAPLREATLVETLNPLNHLPAVVTRPFASAGDTIAAWVKRF